MEKAHRPSKGTVQRKNALSPAIKSQDDGPDCSGRADPDVQPRKVPFFRRLVHQSVGHQNEEYILEASRKTAQEEVAESDRASDSMFEWGSCRAHRNELKVVCPIVGRQLEGKDVIEVERDRRRVAQDRVRGAV